MQGTFNIYCDESCHLEHDRQKVMALGAIWCNEEEGVTAAKRIKEIKIRHGLKPLQEVKWTKISPSKVALYLDLVDYFFDNAKLHFRGLVVPDKELLDHESYGHTHDEWYYKMYFNLLKVILNNTSKFNIYLDIKDTGGGEKVAKLHEVLANDKYDFERKIVQRIQLIRSHEVQVIQLADIMIGALMYKHRGEYTSAAKQKVVERIAERSGYSLDRNTLYSEEKFNLLVWRGGQADYE